MPCFFKKRGWQSLLHGNINLNLYMAIFCKFGLHWLASYNPMSAWIPHMHIFYQTLHCTVYTVQRNVYCTEHSIASCQSALLQFLVSWRTLPPLHYALHWTIYSTLYRTLDFTLYCTLHFTLYSSLYFTPQSIPKPKWLADMT